MDIKLDIVKEYIRLLVAEYELEESDLLKLWTDKHPVSDDPGCTVSDKELKGLKKPELVQLCQNAGLKTTGTKEVLRNRLLGKEETQKTLKRKAGDIRTILSKLTENRETVHIRRNIFNNYEHADSGLVFDAQHDTVIGKQQEDGTVVCLSEEDIDMCKSLGFKYDIPATLYDTEEVD